LALSRFAEVKWEAKQLKNIALLILFCGMLFSTISYAKRMSLMEPEPNLAEALTKLSAYPEGRVLSYSAYSDFIAYFARMSAYAEPGARDAVQRLNISSEIFYSRRLDYTRNLLEEENIRYIVVDRNMRQGLVWDREDQGLLFLFTNNDSFRRLFGKEVDVEAWEYLPQNANLTAN
jgi:hypothetical protein